MRSKQRIAFVITTLIVVIAALASVAIRLAIAESEGRRGAAADFDELAISLGSVRVAHDLADQPLRLRLLRHYSSSPNLLLALVRSDTKGLLWRLPDRSPYLPSSENFAKVPTIQAPALSSLVLSTPLKSSSELRLEALYVTLPQATIFAACRDAALLVAAWLLIALILWLALGRRGSETTWRVGGPAAPEFPASARNPFEGSSLPDLAETGDASGRNSADEEEIEEEDFEAEADALEPRLVARTTPRAASMGGRESSTSTTGGADSLDATPQGLFSPLSGLGWESYLQDRLDAELSRSASFEQDLSFLAIALEGLSSDDPSYALLGKAIADFFSFKDLAFERGRDGFAIILPNLDADHALRMAEEFYKKATILLREKKTPAPLHSLPLFMGLSSRAGRLVEASRMLGEAGIALERAREEGDTKIIAFKPDPDKYRLYLASKGI